MLRFCLIFDEIQKSELLSFIDLEGYHSRMDEIVEICAKHDVPLIEDAAEALGSEYHGKKCGTFGKFGILSFNGNKIITTSGGGMLLTKEKAARDKAFFWSTQARENAVWYQHNEIGYNYRMSNVVAGIGRAQMKHLEEHRAAKEAIYRRYEAAFRDLPVTMNPYIAEEMHPNFWLSCMLIDEGEQVKPMEIFERLMSLNVETRPIWKPMHMQPVFAGYDFISAEEKPVNEDIFARGLCLPSDIKMTAEEQAFVIEAIREMF